MQTPTTPHILYYAHTDENGWLPDVRFSSWCYMKIAWTHMETHMCQNSCCTYLYSSSHRKLNFSFECTNQADENLDASEIQNLFFTALAKLRNISCDFPCFVGDFSSFGLANHRPNHGLAWLSYHWRRSCVNRTHILAAAIRQNA